MTLPAWLRPWWSFFKRVHRLLTRVLGAVFRRTAPLYGERAVPRGATDRSAETARREPDAVVLHPGGPAESLRRGPAVGQPAGHRVFRAGERIEIPARYALEVRDGTIAGDVGATITPGGLLDYQTSGYFGISGWREHPIYLSPSLGEVQHVDGAVLSLTTRGTAVNYYHFLYDAIGRLGVFEEAMPGVRPDAVVVPHAASYQRQLLELAGVDVPLLQPRAGLAYRADRLLVPSTPNQALGAPEWVTDWLRKRLPPTESSGPRRLYLSRGTQPNTRRYVEEPELVPELERRGFEVLDPGRLSVQDQINAFHAAEVVVSPHGAALTNLTFSQPGTKVLEMFAPTYVHLGLWNITEAIGGMTYRYLVAGEDPGGARVTSAPLADVSIPVERVLGVVDELLA